MPLGVWFLPFATARTLSNISSDVIRLSIPLAAPWASMVRLRGTEGPLQQVLLRNGVGTGGKHLGDTQHMISLYTSIYFILTAKTRFLDQRQTDYLLKKYLYSLRHFTPWGDVTRADVTLHI